MDSIRRGSQEPVASSQNYCGAWDRPLRPRVAKSGDLGRSGQSRVRGFLRQGVWILYSGVAVTVGFVAVMKARRVRSLMAFWTALFERPVCSAIFWWLRAAEAPFARCQMW